MVEKDDLHEENEVITDAEIIGDETEMDLETEDESLKDKLKILRKKLTECEEEKRKYLEDLQRTKADFLNSKRRLEEQLARDKERAADKILLELLTLADSFDTAMADRELWDTIEERWRIGVEAINTKLTAILKSNNVTTIDPHGESFDPERHDAVSNVPVLNDADVHKVMTVFQKGFERNGVMIRPARVAVGTK